MTLYEVSDSEAPDAKPRLIEAGNQAQAIRFCATRFTATPVNAKRAAELGNAGVTVEQAT